MRTIQWLSLAAVTLVIAGCASDDAASEMTTGASADFAAAEPDMGGATRFQSTNGAWDRPARTQSLPGLTEMSTASMAQQQRQVIRNGEISVRVEDVEEAEREITEMVVSGGGYVDSSASMLPGDNPTVDMTIRVVSSGFDDAMQQLAQLGIKLSSKSSTQDVTAQLIDLGVRVKTLTAKEDTFREMLRGARTTNDIILLQERLTQVRTEIERMEAQRKSLSQLASLSTITVHLTENATVPVVASDPNWFGQTFASASSSFMGIGRGLVGLVTWVVVFSPFWLLPILAGSWAWKRYGKRVPPTITQ